MKRAVVATLCLAIAAAAAFAQVGPQTGLPVGTPSGYQPGAAPPGSFMIVQSATGVWRLDTRFGELRHCVLPNGGGAPVCGEPAVVAR